MRQNLAPLEQNEGNRRIMELFQKAGLAFCLGSVVGMTGSDSRMQYGFFLFFEVVCFMGTEPMHHRVFFLRHIIRAGW